MIKISEYLSFYLFVIISYVCFPLSKFCKLFLPTCLYHISLPRVSLLFGELVDDPVPCERVRVHSGIGPGYFTDSYSICISRLCASKIGLTAGDEAFFDFI